LRPGCRGTSTPLSFLKIPAIISTGSEVISPVTGGMVKLLVGSLTVTGGCISGTVGAVGVVVVVLVDVLVDVLLSLALLVVLVDVLVSLALLVVPVATMVVLVALLVVLVLDASVENG
jgi:hypothetical protein